MVEDTDWCFYCTGEVSVHTVPPEVIEANIRDQLDGVLAHPAHPEFERVCSLMRHQILHIRDIHLKPLQSAHGLE
jgi:hypothetical protein